MRFSIFDDDETMGGDSPSSGTATFSGTADGVSTAYAEGVLSSWLKTALNGNGFGTKSISVRRVGSTRQVNFTVVFDWACNDTSMIRESLESNIRGVWMSSLGTVSARLVGTTGCKAAPAPKAGTPKVIVDTTAKPPEVKLTWEQWFEKYQTPILVGGVAVVLLLRR